MLVIETFPKLLELQTMDNYSFKKFFFVYWDLVIPNIIGRYFFGIKTKLQVNSVCTLSIICTH